VFEFVAVSCCGAFFGAALYITLVQHPAALEVGPSFAGRFFAPMYRRASVMQVPLALVGTLAALGVWWQRAGLAWLLGALLLLTVIPFTLVGMMPINHRLLAPGRDPEAPDTETLLRRWGALHAVRTALSGLAFVLLLGALAFK
jgi:hypothetical protein